MKEQSAHTAKALVTSSAMFAKGKELFRIRLLFNCGKYVYHFTLLSKKCIADQKLLNSSEILVISRFSIIIVSDFSL